MKDYLLPIFFACFKIKTGKFDVEVEFRKYQIAFFKDFSDLLYKKPSPILRNTNPYKHDKLLKIHGSYKNVFLSNFLFKPFHRKKIPCFSF